MIGSVTNPVQQYVSPGLRTDQNSSVPAQSASPSKSLSTGNTLSSSISPSAPASGRGSLVDIYA